MNDGKQRDQETIFVWLGPGDIRMSGLGYGCMVKARTSWDCGEREGEKNSLLVTFLSIK